MYSDPDQWLRIRHRVLVEGASQRQVARQTGITTNTIRKMLRNPEPVPYGPRERVFPKLGPYKAAIRQLLQEREGSPPNMRQWTCEICDQIRRQGYTGSSGIVRQYIAALATDRLLWEEAYDQVRSLDRRKAVSLLMQVARQCQTMKAHGAFRAYRDETTNQAFTWMRKVMQKQISGTALRHELGEMPDLHLLLDSVYEGRLSERTRALAVLAKARGWKVSAICAFLCIDRKTCDASLAAFESGRAAGLLRRRPPPNRKLDDEDLKSLIFTVLHEPPSNYGVNRTTWTMATLGRVLAEKGQPACKDTIRKITRQAGWRWRKAREVLTSSDPDYTEKVARLRTTLANLQPDEAFFSIDEFGPFGVKMRNGRALTPPGELRVIPAWQESRGSLIVTGALELSGNQMTHFYSERKNTAEMIRLVELLLEVYPTHRKLYLSWDDATWHRSKRLNAWIDQHNASAQAGERPTLGTMPLPSSAQFLNVIESVFSGMARAVIHNSNYASVEEAKVAIDFGCSDSRVPANQIVALDPGELFVHRNVANLAPPQDANYLAVLQFAVDVLKVKHIIVVGHYGCGGVSAAVDGMRRGLVDHWLHPIREVYDEHRHELEAVGDERARLDRLCELNVIRQVRNVASDVIVKGAWASGRTLSVHGWVYSLADGLIKDLNVTVSQPEQTGEEAK